MRCVAIRQLIFYVSQIGMPFHGICPPSFIQTWLHQYLRAALRNPICFRSAWCRRTMIPGKIFTRFANFMGLSVRVTSWFPRRLQELLQALLRYLRSFGLARIRLDPLGGQVLHHDCISMIVSRFTTFTENFVICCYQVTKFFCTRYGSTNASSARSPCNFGLVTDLAISVFEGSEYKHCACPNPQFSKVLKMVHEKNWRVSLCSQELCHPRDFLWILAAIPGSPRSFSWFSFLFGFGFFVGLGNDGSHRSIRSTCELDTGTG